MRNRVPPIEKSRTRVSSQPTTNATVHAITDAIVHAIIDAIIDATVVFEGGGRGHVFSLADWGCSVGALPAALVSFGLSSLRSGETAEWALDDRSPCGGGSVSGECVLEDSDVMLEASDLSPEPVAFTGQLDHPASERNRVEVAMQGVALLTLDGAVGAHPFGVVGPFAWATRTGPVSHANHFRTCVYSSKSTHMHQGSARHRSCVR